MERALFLLGRYELLNPDNPKHRSATCVVLFARDAHAGRQAAGSEAGDAEQSDTGARLDSKP